MAASINSAYPMLMERPTPRPKRSLHSPDINSNTAQDQLGDYSTPFNKPTVPPVHHRAKPRLPKYDRPEIIHHRTSNTSNTSNNSITSSTSTLYSPQLFHLDIESDVRIPIVNNSVRNSIERAKSRKNESEHLKLGPPKRLAERPFSMHGLKPSSTNFSYPRGSRMSSRFSEPGARRGDEDKGVGGLERVETDLSCERVSSQETIFTDLTVGDISPNAVSAGNLTLQEDTQMQPNTALSKGQFQPQPSSLPSPPLPRALPALPSCGTPLPLPKPILDALPLSSDSEIHQFISTSLSQIFDQNPETVEYSPPLLRPPTRFSISATDSKLQSPVDIIGEATCPSCGKLRSVSPEQPVLSATPKLESAAEPCFCPRTEVEFEKLKLEPLHQETGYASASSSASDTCRSVASSTSLSDDKSTTFSLKSDVRLLSLHNPSCPIKSYNLISPSPISPRQYITSRPAKTKPLPPTPSPGSISTNPMSPVNQKQSPTMLPCEHCPKRFHARELSVWIAHTTSHYAPDPPPRSARCMFCDRWPDAKATLIWDPEVFWRERMVHIWTHYVNQGIGQGRSVDCKGLKRWEEEDQKKMDVGAKKSESESEGQGDHIDLEEDLHMKRQGRKRLEHRVEELMRTVSPANVPWQRENRFRRNSSVKHSRGPQERSIWISNELAKDNRARRRWKAELNDEPANRKKRESEKAFKGGYAYVEETDEETLCEIELGRHGENLKGRVANEGRGRERGRVWGSDSKANMRAEKLGLPAVKSRRKGMTWVVGGEGERGRARIRRGEKRERSQGWCAVLCG